MSDERWVSQARGLLRDADGRVLVIGSADHASLPYAEVEGTDDELPGVRAAFAALVGTEVVVIRSVARAVDEERRVLDVAFELESLEPVTTSPSGTMWLGGAELAGFSLSDRDRELVERLFDDRPPPERPQWARPGWFAEATAWIESALARVGRSAVGPVEQISNWCISSILRVPTAEGMVFFKATASSPLFVEEGSVTQGLARLFPGHIPLPIAVDRERRWMLLDDFGPLVGWKASLETRIEVLSCFGRIQVESADRVDELLALGVFDRRPAWLAGEIEALLGASEALGLEDADIDQLAALVPTLVEGCERLAAGTVPDTLVHGDLHMGNVAGSDGRYVFFDWTDACVTHPFLELLAILFEDDADSRRALRDGYLSVWEAFASKDDLLELWRLAEPLASLNQAVSYRSILESVEPGTGPELGSMLPYWLRKALAVETLGG